MRIYRVSFKTSYVKDFNKRIMVFDKGVLQDKTERLSTKLFSIQHKHAKIFFSARPTISRWSGPTEDRRYSTICLFLFPLIRSPTWVDGRINGSVKFIQLYCWCHSQPRNHASLPFVGKTNYGKTRSSASAIIPRACPTNERHLGTRQWHSCAV